MPHATAPLRGAEEEALIVGRAVGRLHGPERVQDVFTGAEVTIAFEDEDRPGYFAIINADMELAELGWIKFPKLMHLGWAAQWLQYEARLKANLTRPALEVPIFKEQASSSVIA